MLHRREATLTHKAADPVSCSSTYSSRIIVVMYKILSVLGAALALSAWKYHSLKDKNTDHANIISLSQKQPQEKEWEKGLTTSMEQKKELKDLTVKLKPQLKKESPKQEEELDEVVTTPKEVKTELEQQRDQPKKESPKQEEELDEVVTTPKEVKTELEQQRDQPKKESPKQEEELDEVVTTPKEVKTELEQQRDQPKKNCTELIMKDRLMLEPAFTAFSLDTVFVFLLIHTFGVDLVESISTVSGCMSSAGILADLAFSFILVAYTAYKSKCEKAEMVKENTQLQKESLNKDKDQEVVVTTLMEVKTELENQRSRLKELLKEVEREREANKQKLQAVDTEITEREITFDKPEELLKEKENLLKDQWKLAEKKQNCERQLLSTERLLEPIEIQVTRIHRAKEANMQI